MVIAGEDLACPVCGIDRNGSGERFRSFRAVALHVAGKAITWNDEHWEWILDLLPNADIRFGNINPLAAQIEFYVREALEEEFPDHSQDDETLMDSLGLALAPAEQGERTTEELEQYLRAYSYIWEVESRLHRFVAIRLGSEDKSWWLSFPLQMKQKCMEMAHNDGDRVPPDCYIDFRDLGEIIKHKKEAFTSAFDPLKDEHPDPRSSFLSMLNEANQIRNDVMHPLKRLTPTPETIERLERFANFVRQFTSQKT